MVVRSLAIGTHMQPVYKHNGVESNPKSLENLHKEQGNPLASPSLSKLCLIKGGPLLSPYDARGARLTKKQRPDCNSQDMPTWSLNSQVKIASAC